MFKDSKAFSSFSVDDLQKAKDFYGQTLGLEVSERPEGLELLSGQVFVYSKPNHTPATFTVLNFVVDNIEQVVDELTKKGVEFEQYTNEYIKTDGKGISKQDDRSMAWFKDPAGNILGILQDH